VIGGKKKYIEMFGSFTEPFNYNTDGVRVRVSTSVSMWHNDS